MNEVYIGLGANIGERERYLSEAIERLNAEEAITIERKSSIYETKPVGFKDQNHFLNMVIYMETSLNHLDLLDICQKIESDLGRERRSEEHTSELQSRFDLVCRLLLEKKKNTRSQTRTTSTIT